LPFWARKRERAPEDGAAALPWTRRIAVKGCRMKFAHWGWGIVLWMPLAVSGAQAPQQAQPATQGSAVADAARATRDAKKDQAKPAHVWDNDNLPTVSGGVNVVGQTPSENATDNGAAAGSTGAQAPTGEDKAALERDLASAKDKLATLQTDLDILQRTFTLDQQSFYGKPDFESDAAGAKKLKDEQASIDAKQQQIEEMQKQIADLQSKVNAASDAKASNAGASAAGAGSANPPAGGEGGDNGNSNSGGANQGQPAQSSAPVPQS